MDRFFTIMIVPESEKGVRSIRIPRILFRSLSFFIAISILFLGILGYDYVRILREVYENKHLVRENITLKDQIQKFQMKLNLLNEDFERIDIFEKKLRIITGIDKVNFEDNYIEKRKETPNLNEQEQSSNFDTPNQAPNLIPKESEISSDPRYIKLKNLYDQEIASTFGLQTGYRFTKEWSKLTQKSFELSKEFARFDYKFNTIKEYVKNLEVRVHEFDQLVLDKISMLNSTPTVMPTKGWITSYYGPRKSPTSGRLKMHEGIDIGAKPSTSIISPADGIVTFAGKKPGFGKFVQINHGYSIETIYGHAKSVKVKAGQKVKRGATIATVGSTGLSTGPHVHYEIRVNGVPVDPMYFILD